MDTSPIANAAVTAAAGVIAWLGLRLTSQLPLLVTWLRVYIDGNDATRLRYAIGNAAQAAMAAIDGGQPQDQAVKGMVKYVKEALPSALARLGPTDERLATMCEGELARLMAGRG